MYAQLKKNTQNVLRIILLYDNIALVNLFESLKIYIFLQWMTVTDAFKNSLQRLRSLSYDIDPI